MMKGVKTLLEIMNADQCNVKLGLKKIKLEIAKVEYHLDYIFQLLLIYWLCSISVIFSFFEILLFRDSVWTWRLQAVHLILFFIPLFVDFFQYKLAAWRNLSDSFLYMTG